MKLIKYSPHIILIVLFLSCTKKIPAFKKYEFATPEEVGMISDSLSKIDKMVNDFIKAEKYPGAVTLIAKDGKIIYESEIGFSDSLKSEPYRKDHLFRMASMTKPIVSVAAMQLIEKGKLSLDDEVGKYIPSFKNTEILIGYNPKDTTWTTRPTKTKPTVRQLLTHTAGVPYGFMNPNLNLELIFKVTIHYYCGAIKN